MNAAEALPEVELPNDYYRSGTILSLLLPHMLSERHLVHAAASGRVPRTRVLLDRGSFTPEQCTNALVQAVSPSKNQPEDCTAVCKMLFEACGCSYSEYAGLCIASAWLAQGEGTVVSQHERIGTNSA